jgi:hypothetical protein
MGIQVKLYKTRHGVVRELSKSDLALVRAKNAGDREEVGDYNPH